MATKTSPDINYSGIFSKTASHQLTAVCAIRCYSGYDFLLFSLVQTVAHQSTYLANFMICDCNYHQITNFPMTSGLYIGA